MEDVQDLAFWWNVFPVFCLTRDAKRGLGRCDDGSRQGVASANWIRSNADSNPVFENQSGYRYGHSYDRQKEKATATIGLLRCKCQNRGWCRENSFASPRRIGDRLEPSRWRSAGGSIPTSEHTVGKMSTMPAGSLDSCPACT